jgi:hypothetical protein
MAEYTPPTDNVPIFDVTNFAPSGSGLTEAQIASKFLRFPTGQGTETLPALITGSITAPNIMNIVMPNALASNVLNVGVVSRNISGQVHHYSDGDNCVAGAGVHLNNGVNNASTTNIANGTTSTGTVNIMSGTNSSGVINIGATNGATDTTTFMSGITTIDKLKTNLISGTANNVVMNIGQGITIGDTGVGINLGNDLTTGALNIGNSQTSGNIGIGTLATRNGSINIGTGGSSTASIGIGGVGSTTRLNSTTVSLGPQTPQNSSSTITIGAVNGPNTTLTTVNGRLTATATTNINTTGGLPTNIGGSGSTTTINGGVNINQTGGGSTTIGTSTVGTTTLLGSNVTMNGTTNNIIGTVNINGIGSGATTTSLITIGNATVGGITTLSSPTVNIGNADSLINMNATNIKQSIKTLDGTIIENVIGDTTIVPSMSTTFNRKNSATLSGLSCYTITSNASAQFTSQYFEILVSGCNAGRGSYTYKGCFGVEKIDTGNMSPSSVSTLFYFGTGISPPTTTVIPVITFTATQQVLTVLINTSGGSSTDQNFVATLTSYPTSSRRVSAPQLEDFLISAV